MSDQPTERGAAEELTDAPATPAEQNQPALPASIGGDARARGAAEDASDSRRTE